MSVGSSLNEVDAISGGGGETRSEWEFTKVVLQKRVHRLERQVEELQRANNREVERKRHFKERARFLEGLEPEIYIGIKKIVDEHRFATKRYPPFASTHEGYAVLKEEVDELWDEVKKKPGEHQMIGAEAKQVGAMALRMLVEFGE